MCDDCNRLKVSILALLDLLNKEEESDSGRVFKPNNIYSSRALDCVKIEGIMADLEREVEYKEYKEINSEKRC